MALNRLKNLYCYLSGPIDEATDNGVGWREDITPFLEDMGVKVLNPLAHSFVGADKIPEKRKKMKILLENEKFEELHQEMKDLVHMDLRSVDLASFVICNYDSTIHMCGTYEEIFSCNLSVKPCLLVHKKPRCQLSSWMYGRFPPDHFFSSWDDLREYLRKINSDPNYKFTKADLKRWLFFNE
jgi:hypothetical protein